jgi:hypothetical protein
MTSASNQLPSPADGRVEQIGVSDLMYEEYDLID